MCWARRVLTRGTRHAPLRCRLLSEGHEVEADLLRRQVATLAAELVERDRMLHTIHSMKGLGPAARGDAGGEDDVAMQVGRVAVGPHWLGQAG